MRLIPSLVRAWSSGTDGIVPGLLLVAAVVAVVIWRQARSGKER